MQILSSGSFINLENREKIEQLIFTAKELANTASQTAGFVNAGVNNQHLALEMWQGAEYMCRDHEEATIKNIFLSNFLERLRDVGRVAMSNPLVTEVARIQPAPPPAAQYLPPVNIQVPNSSAFLEEGTISAAETLENVTPIPELVTTNDEYLGMVASTENSYQDTGETHSYADECVPESELEIIEQCGEVSAEVEDEFEIEANKSFNDDVPASFPIETSTLPLATPVVSEEITIKPTTLEDKSIAAIVVPAKEPYQLENCTVRAVIQVLAADRGVRKCVISIVTHDFSPEIAVAELDAADFINGLPSVIAPVFERYKTDFPIKVADKLKKEKSVAKKQSSKAGDKSKANSSRTASNKVADNAATETVVTQASPSTSDQQTSLFGS